MAEFFTPDFIIPGASRCGTSTLHSALSQHPDIFMPPQKELQFFFRDADFAKGPEFYAQYFKAANTHNIKGEASPPYFEKSMRLSENGHLNWDETQDCAARIKALYPDIKLIFSLRDPVSRATSMYWKHIWQGRENAPTIEQVIEEEQNGARIPQDDFMCLLYRNHYKIHMENWLSHFPRNQILILIFEEWTKHPAQAMVQIENFLELAPSGFTDDDIQPKNEGRGVAHPALKPLMKIGAKIPALHGLTRKLFTKPGYPPLKPDTQTAMRAHFTDDLAYTESLIDRKITAWA